MKYFFDTEFVEDGKTIDLISIAVVSEDGREFVRYNYDFDETKANDWVRANVFPHLPEKPALCAVEQEHGLWRNHEQIGYDLILFIGKDAEPEFWADFAAYDWVALCQLFGTMMNLPAGFPMFCRDVQQLRKMLGIPKFTVLSHGEHDALADAKECKARHDVLQIKLLEWAYGSNE